MAKKSSRMRRLLSGVLSAVMLATLVPSTAFAIGRTDTGSFLTGPYLMTPKTNGMVVVWELDKRIKSGSNRAIMSETLVAVSKRWLSLTTTKRISFEFSGSVRK